jgi:bifunctional enzyme CysN/CysC
MAEPTVRETLLADYLKKDLLRLTTAGSVDDGKSTLIGRLLFDSKAIFQDQMDQLEQTSRLRGEEGVNLALLTDGLRAEREQGITIDVAYRYFSTPKRKFIIADTPGHEQYTRNMVTGASTADLAIILIDARNGVITQSKRHGFIASLLGIPHLVVAVNKMDLVDYSQERFDQIVADYTDFSSKLDVHDITFIPVSALNGDNVVDRSSRMEWYDGPVLLSHLERVTISADRNLVDFRFPVQFVIRPHQDFRGFAGTVLSGSVSRGERVLALPGRRETEIAAIHTHDGTLEEAYEGQAVTLTLKDEIDISRGDMIVRRNNVPRVATTIDTTLCWMDDQRPFGASPHYLLQHGTRIVQARLRDLLYKIDVNTLHRADATQLDLNEIGRVVFSLSGPIFCDPYHDNRANGGFVLIDPSTNRTVAAGMVRADVSAGTAQAEESHERSPNVVWDEGTVTAQARESRNGHRGLVVWLTGLSGSGKSTISKAVEAELFAAGRQVYRLDGDNVRHGLNGDLGFSGADRSENIRRVGEVARLFCDAGHIVLCSFISPYAADRAKVRALLEEGQFLEVFVDCPLEEAKRRDPKGLYKKAADGELTGMTGIDAPYEAPASPELTLHTDTEPLAEAAARLRDAIEEAVGL